MVSQIVSWQLLDRVVVVLVVLTSTLSVVPVVHLFRLHNVPICEAQIMEECAAGHHHWCKGRLHLNKV